MTTQAEPTPATVPLAQQAGATDADREIRSRWRWVEPCAWTVRMLTALEQGVKGTKWFRLFDKVFAERNLLAAFQQVARSGGAAGVDHVTARDFERQFPDVIWELSDLLQAGTFTPQAIRRVHIPKPGTSETRPLGIPTVRDRVVQAAMVNVIEPIFERDFASIPHEGLMARLETKIADGPVLRLIEAFLKADILDEMSQWTPEAGAPQGAVLSPLLSNIYLDPLDHLLADAGFEMVRYADDFVILCRTADNAARALELVRQWTADNGLTLHPTKTKVIDARTDRFDFLGYTFRGTKHGPRKKSLTKLKDTLRLKTCRKSGDSLPCIVKHVNQTLRGWFEYFQHSSYRNVFRDLDGCTRMRLRSILRKRAGRRGRGRGADHQRWPNRFFAEHGLFSLATAHALVLQSSSR